MKALFRTCLLMFTVFSFAGCGGGSSDGGPSLTPIGGNQSVRFGSYNGTTFTANRIASNSESLTAGQSANLSVSFVDRSNTPVFDSADVLFTSPCISAGLSEVSPAVATNSSGTVSTTYTARGCKGIDNITAQTNIGGTTLKATTSITTASAPLGSITYLPPNPESPSDRILIGIRGTGALPEQAVVSFLVSNEAGGPVPNLDVDFSLNTTVGDISLSNTTGTTNADGVASTTVISGTVATSVRVKAEAFKDGKQISAQSNQLINTVGIIDQNSFTLGATPLNIEGFRFNGVESSLTILAADRFNNPAPDGTAIAFTAEGGIVDSGCVTLNGTCTVIFRSANPRPDDGRATVTATAIGEESFEDTNPSNGSYDGEEFTDLPEAFSDYNENGCRDSNEPYLDFNKDGNFSGSTIDSNNDGVCSGDEIQGNGRFDGLRCTSGTGTLNCETTPISVREDIVIVMSDSSFEIDILPATINLDGGTQTVTFAIQDQNGQVPPAGTVISASTDQGTISGTISDTVVSTNARGPLNYTVQIKPGAKAGTGTFLVTVTTPMGLISRNTAIVTQANDAP
ncbi:MAG: hypothetical protein ACJA1I_000897 [Zhongshania marina]|jgi:hypothetical protein